LTVRHCHCRCPLERRQLLRGRDKLNAFGVFCGESKHGLCFRVDDSVAEDRFQRPFGWQHWATWAKDTFCKSQNFSSSLAALTWRDWAKRGPRRPRNPIGEALDAQRSEKRRKKEKRGKPKKPQSSSLMPVQDATCSPPMGRRREDMMLLLSSFFYSLTRPLCRPFTEPPNPSLHAADGVQPPRDA